MPTPTPALSGDEAMPPAASRPVTGTPASSPSSHVDASAPYGSRTNADEVSAVIPGPVALAARGGGAAAAPNSMNVPLNPSLGSPLPSPASNSYPAAPLPRYPMNPPQSHTPPPISPRNFAAAHASGASASASALPSIGLGASAGQVSLPPGLHPRQYSSRSAHAATIHALTAAGESTASVVATANDLAYLETIERSLVDSVAKLNLRLTDTRSAIYGGSARSRAAMRRPRGGHTGKFTPAFNTPRLGSRLGYARSSDDAPSDSSVFSRIPSAPLGQAGAGTRPLGGASGMGSVSGGGIGAPPPLRPLRQRIITVSLYLPTKADRESARQQLFDSRLPPKGMFALENATDLSFVWVGAPDPALAAGSPEALEELYGTPQHAKPMLEENHGDLQRQRGQSHIVQVTLPKEEELLSEYATFSNKTLWNMLHYDYSALAADDEMCASEAHWNAYRVVNQCFAEAVSEIYEEGDLIWVHNYHLMLVPSMLRQRLWYAKIGFFLYAPFPSAELFRILPYRVEILKGVLGSDLVGFHTYDYSKQFAASCTRLLGLEGTPKGIEVEPRAARHCEFGIYPAGIDVRDLKVRIGSKAVKARITSLRRRFGDRKVIVGVDRLDDAFAGIALKLLSFEKFLADNEAWRGRVVLVQVSMVPKHLPKADEAHRHRAEINEFVARINSTYGTLAFSPIHHVNEELDPTEVHALMCVGHVCMVSNVRDGMGLVPYEWTVCQHGGYKGCLILSEFAGAAASFSTALHVNPWNIDDVAEKIKRSLEMKLPERVMRDASAYSFVNTHTASLWGLNFLEDLEQADSGAEGPGAMITPVLDVQAVIDAFFYRASSIVGAWSTPSVPSAGGYTTPSPSSMYAFSALRHNNDLFLDRGHGAADFHGVGGGSGQAFVTSSNNSTRSPSPTVQPGFANATSPYPHAPISSSTAMSIISPPMPRVSPPLPVEEGSGKVAPALHLPMPVDGLGSGEMNMPASAAPGSKRQKKKKLFVLDYDGTLMPSQAIAELVAPSAQVLQVVEDLSSLKYVYVVLLSGRDRSTLSQWFGHLDIFLAAEDGSFLRGPGETEWVALFRRTPDDNYGARHYDADGFSPSMASVSTPTQMVSAASSFETGGGYVPSDSGGDGGGVMNPSLPTYGPGYSSGQRRDDRSGNNGDSVFSDGGIEDDLKSTATSLAAADGSAAETYVHPLLAGTSRHKWSTSSFGSVGADPSVIPEWKAQVMPIMHHFAERTPGVILEEGDASLTWYFSEADREFGRLQARDLLKHLESFLLQHLSIEVVSEEGSNRYSTRWVKVRPSGVDKSIVIERVLEWIRDESSGSNNDSWYSASAAGVGSNSGSHHSVSGAKGAGLSSFAIAAAKATAAHAASLKAEARGGGDGQNGGSGNGASDADTPSTSNAGLYNGSGGFGADRERERPVVDFIFCAGDDRADEGMYDLLNDESKLAGLNLAAIVTRIFTCHIGSGPTAASAVLDTPQKLLELLESICSRSSADVPEEIPAPTDSKAGHPNFSNGSGFGFRMAPPPAHPGSW